MSNESTSVQHRLATDATLARVVDALEELPTGLQQAKDNANNAASRASAIAGQLEDMEFGVNTLQPGQDATISKSVDPETGDITLTLGIPKGADGRDGEGVRIHICSSSEYDSTTHVPTVQNPVEGTFYLVPSVNAVSPDLFVEWAYVNNAWEVFGSATVEVPVTDVQVNGTSILNAQGVANVPRATSSSLGVVIADGSYGIEPYGIMGRIQISRATDSQIKNGSSTVKPIVAAVQHQSTFYGLAKAAGADMKDIASTTVGVYPEAQKSAISQMLNGSVAVTGTTPSITALPGIRYVCGEVVTLDIMLPASGIVDVVFESGSTATVLTITPPTGLTVKWANGFDPTALEANTTYEINIADGLGVAAAWS